MAELAAEEILSREATRLWLEIARAVANKDLERVSTLNDRAAQILIELKKLTGAKA